MHLPRTRDEDRLRRLLRVHPVVGILGPRQVGKTTLARDLAKRQARPATVFDLEDPADLARLADARLTLEPLRGLVVVDEIQRRPDLFPVLRVLADRPRHPARFLVLGSASPELLRQSSESLAGRVAYHELGGFSLEDVGNDRADRLWLRGGFPRSFLARTEREGDEWRRAFVRTFVERDLPQLGVTIPPATLERFWAMLAHYHGQVWNASEFARSFGVSDATVRRYLDLLSATFAVRVLLPWSENLGKRQVRSPKVYFADCGLLHALLGIRERRDLERHPKLGASWEGFALDAIVRRLGVEPRECHFWATHAGAELDLLVVRGRRRWGFEFKRTSAPAVTRSMRVALDDLRLERLDVVHGGPHSFTLAPRIRAVAFSRLLDDVPTLN
jgi:predicted AAA+ superfamily ATPase